ncbi:hypothetical protein PanWU01x14_020540 [Parasponia andersonii]|uniref:Uncharacterized protein n=1 Tax=Parasponia andersonii TaxID=3476 RepID=A0A2P5DYS4_PARAD|nr:hypothetical protein PanWU01x14_020540 [Parasponia andersonii]
MEVMDILDDGQLDTHHKCNLSSNNIIVKLPRLAQTMTCASIHCVSPEHHMCNFISLKFVVVRSWIGCLDLASRAMYQIFEKLTSHGFLTLILAVADVHLSAINILEDLELKSSVKAFSAFTLSPDSARA